jgi:hypothetical protein
MKENARKFRDNCQRFFVHRVATICFRVKNCNGVNTPSDECQWERDKIANERAVSEQALGPAAGIGISVLVVVPFRAQNKPERFQMPSMG